MIIISPEDTSLGLKLSLSFKVTTFFFFTFLDNVHEGPNGQEGYRSASTAEGSQHPRATESTAEHFNLLRGRVKSLMLWHTLLLWRLDVKQKAMITEKHRHLTVQFYCKCCGTKVM